jgi:hypothetical protein
MARYYNYYTGQWVDSPDQIKPQAVAPLQDVGFMAAAAQSGQPFVPPSAPAQGQDDVGFRQAAAASGAPFVDPTPRATIDYIDDIMRRVPDTGAYRLPETLREAFPSYGSIIGYEYQTGKTSATSNTRRAKVADGRGGFVYGVWEENPEFSPSTVKTGAGAGGEEGDDFTVIPGSTGTTTKDARTLALDTFKNTLALLFGKEEASKPYIDELYRLASGFYKSGSTIEESMNLALREAREKKTIPEFTNRFRAIFALEELNRKGIPVRVPTIAEFVKSQQDLSDILRRSNLAELATEDFLNDVFSTGKSVLEATNIINNVFKAIDNAPEDWKALVAQRMPFADRSTLAKAILTGDKGAEELERRVQTLGVEAQAQRQGLNIGEDLAGEIYRRGYTYGTATPRFAQAAALKGRGQFLSGIEGGPELTEGGLVKTIFDENYEELQKLQQMSEREQMRFASRTGLMRSSLRASGSALDI